MALGLCLVTYYFSDGTLTRGVEKITCGEKGSLEITVYNLACPSLLASLLSYTIQNQQPRGGTPYTWAEPTNTSH